MSVTGGGVREEGGELMLLELGQVNSLVGTNDETGANKSIKPGQDLITTSLKAEPTVKLMSHALSFILC